MAGTVGRKATEFKGFTDEDLRSIKLVVQGNVNVGKRDLLLAYTNPNYPEEYELIHEFDPFPFTHYTLENLQQRKIVVDLFDSSGIEDSLDVRKIFYRKTDVFLLLYSVVDHQSFSDIVSIWYPEIIEYCPDAIVILIANEISKRNDEKIITELAQSKKKPITSEEGERLAQEIGAHRYYEVCVDGRIGIWEVFDLAVKEVLRLHTSPSKPELGLYPLFCRTGTVEQLENCYYSKKYNVNLVIGENRSSFSIAIEAKNYLFAKKLLEYEGGIANLSNSNLDSIPEILIEWVNQNIIKEINLDNNQLNSIPNDFTILRNVSIYGNPLQSIPVEFHNAKWKKLKQYLTSVAEKTANWNIRKLIVVGEEGVGKTTLSKCLGSKSGKVDTSANLSTDGIDIQEIRIKKIIEKGEKGVDKEYTFNTWDFGGQIVFYPTHQFFLSNGAIYVIVFDMSNFKFPRIEYWMKQLKQLNGDGAASLIIMVGTHAEQCKEEEIVAITDKILGSFPKRLFPAFQNMVIPVSCKTGNGIKQLKDNLLQLAEHPALSPVVSESWVKLYELVKNNLEAGKDYVSWSTYQVWCESCGVPNDQLDLITEFLMKTGSVLNFDDKLDKNLKDLVILNPQWLARVMSCLITTKGNFVTEGYLLLPNVRKIFTAYPVDIQTQLLSLLEKFKITFPITIDGTEKILVPSLLPSTRPSSEIIKSFPTKLPIEKSTFGRTFQFGQLPLGLIGRLMISLLRLPLANGEIFWRNGLLINFDSRCQIFLEYNGEEYYLEIQSRFLHQDKQYSIQVWRSVLETIKTLIESFYPRLAEMKVESIPCIHCYKSGVYKEKVFVFSYNDVDQAARRGEHLVYCNGIKSPYRTVFISDMAPDIGMADLPRISEETLVIEKEIGEGGFGKVYKGSIGNTKVAIKELKFGGDDEENNQKFQEFQTECYMMNLLRHPNIVELYGILMNPPRMVLEFVTGGDLFGYMHTKTDVGLNSISQEKFLWKTRYQIAMDIAKGLHYLQCLTPPVIHRDLRSPNIFMTAEGKAIIGDFGMARVVQSGEIGGLLGTWQWVAPEALSSTSETYDQRTDIYSYGVILWELAAIAMPFEEYCDNSRYFQNGTYKLIEIKQAIVDEGLRPTIPPKTPLLFSNLIQDCWNSDPSKRPSTTSILKTLSDLSGEKIDDVIEQSNVSLPSNIFVNVEEAEKSIMQKAEEKPQPVALIEIDADSREKFSCLCIVNDLIWIGSNLGSISVFEYKAGEGFTLAMRKKRQRKRISQLINVSGSIWSVSDDGTVNCWNSDTFELEHEWMPLGDDKRSAATSCILFPKDSVKKLYEGKINQQVWFISPLEGRVTAWSAQTREYLKSITHEELLGAMTLEFHKGYVWIASGTSGNKICMYDAKTLDHIGSFIAHDSRITSILSLGDQVWTSSVEDIRVWDAASIDSLCVFKTSKIQQSKIECMINNGNRVFAGSFDGTVFLFDENTVNALQELVNVDGVRFIGFFSSSDMFVTFGQFHLTLWPNANDMYAPSGGETIKISLDLENLIPESSGSALNLEMQNSDEKPSKKWRIKLGPKIPGGKK